MYHNAKDAGVEKRNSRGVKELEMQRAGEGRRLGSQFRDPFHVCFMLMVRALSNLLGQYVRISLSICQNSSHKNDFIYIHTHTHILFTCEFVGKEEFCSLGNADNLFFFFEMLPCSLFWGSDGLLLLASVEALQKCTEECCTVSVNLSCF